MGNYGSHDFTTNNDYQLIYTKRILYNTSVISYKPNNITEMFTIPYYYLNLWRWPITKFPNTGNLHSTLPITKLPSKKFGYNEGKSLHQIYLFTYKYIGLNEKPPIMKQNFCIFFFVIGRVECMLPMVISPIGGPLKQLKGGQQVLVWLTFLWII